MKRLFNIELQKLRYNRAAKVLIIIYFALFLSIVLFSSIHFHIGAIDFQLADQGIFNFPFIWHFNAYFAAILKIFLGFVIIAIVTAEFSNNTLKQNLIDGLSKKEFVYSKFSSLIIFSVGSTVFLFIISLILGLIFSDYTEMDIVFSGMQHIGGYFLKLTAFFSFCFFLGVLLKRAAFAIGALFVWWIFEGIIHVTLQILMKGSDAVHYIMGFLPLDAMSNMVKEPFRRMKIVQAGAQSVGAQTIYDYGIHWYEIIIILIWIFLFIGGSYWLIKKRDL